VHLDTRGVYNNDGALLHEIVHVYAPNENRFLESVYGKRLDLLEKEWRVALQ
jgi:hypothetical protein